MREQAIEGIETSRTPRNLLTAAKATGAAILASLAIGGPAPGAVATAEAASRPYFEYTPPPGELKGVALVIHGGGWSPTSTGKQAVTDPYMLQQASDVRRAGFGSLNIDYHAGRRGFLDILAFHSLARRIAKDRPVCAVGVSAGGHWALQLAAAKKVDCVVTEGAPVDLTNVRGLTRYYALNAFAPGLSGSTANSALRFWSPAAHKHRLSTRGLIGNAQNDKLVEPDQARLLQDVPGINVDILDPGRAPFTHAPVNEWQLLRFRLRKIGLLLNVAHHAQTAVKTSP